MQLLGPAVASFALCLLAILALRPVAFAINLIDRPSGRKVHESKVPVVGGLAMLVGIVFGLGLTPLPGPVVGVFLSASAVLVVTGLIDDRFDLSPWTRLPVQATAAILMMLGADIEVVHLGAPFGSEIWLEGWVSYAFTVVAVVAGLNAFNMLDGMDGLAGAMAIVALTALAFFAAAGGVAVAMVLSVVVMGAVAAFLVSNLPIEANRGVRCFMGDSGSTLLGFAVTWLVIVVSQAPASTVAPVTVLWVVALPLYEVIWTVLRRVLKGASPFRPDTLHLHHMLQRAGFGVRGAFVVFATLAVLLAAVGVSAEIVGMPESWSFALLCATGALVVRFIHRAEVLWKVLPRSFRVAPLQHLEDANSDG